MSDLIYSTGASFNHLERIPYAEGTQLLINASEAEDGAFPRSNLFDRIVGSAFRFPTIVADPYLTLDANVIRNAGMEIAGSGGAATLADWLEANTGSGDVIRTTTAGEFDTGVAGMELASGSGTASAYQDHVCRPGETLLISGRGKSNGTANLRLRVRNLDTGNYLSTGFSWGAAVTHVGTRSANTWGDLVSTPPGQFVVEPYSSIKRRKTTLRVSLHMETGSVTCWADNIFMWPATDLFSLHGHNITSILTAELRRSTDNFSGSNILEATLTQQPLSFFYVFPTLRIDRYWRLRLVGTPVALPLIGEWVLSQRKTASRRHSFGGTVTWIRPSIRQETPAGLVRTHPLSDDPYRVWRAPIRLAGATAHDEFRDELYDRAGLDEHPVVWIPEDTDPRVCLYGYLPNENEVTRQFLASYTGQITVVEQPFPSIVS